MVLGTIIAYLLQNTTRSKYMAETHVVQVIKDDAFDKDVESGLTLVDFWAEWCMPCRMQAPIMEEVAKDLGDKVTVGKLNVDENPETAMRFGITGIPTSILFKDGQEVRRFVGVQSKQTLVKAIEGSL
jgi:thioredoxin 1